MTSTCCALLEGGLQKRGKAYYKAESFSVSSPSCDYRRGSAMPLFSHLHQLCNTDTGQVYIHMLRRKERPLQRLRCHSHNVSPGAPTP
jgi:hypothetical protein